ncbi:MAG: helix-turn-helix domain-containing protein [Phycisphaerales bacterium]|nr:helix-turn-helix domain-containing protein [Phycisphaerales bacterium]
MASGDDSIRNRSAETIGDRVKRRRRELRLTQEMLAESAGINQGYLSSIERGQREPSRRTIDVLAGALDIPPAVLIGAGMEHDNPQPLETRELPLLGSIPAGRPADTQEQLEMFPVLRHLWAADRFCLRLSFESMEPTLKPGDIVLVHYRPDVDPVLVQGRICACLVDGKPTLKRVTVEQRAGRRVIILHGDNPVVAPMVVEDGAEFAIQGVVMKLVSRDL